MTPEGFQEAFSGFLHEVGARVREIRRSLGLSIEAAALRSGIHQGFWGLVERGAKLPSLKSISKMAAGLGTTPSELLAVDREPAGDSLVRELATLMEGRTRKVQERLFRIFREIVLYGHDEPPKPAKRKS